MSIPRPRPKVRLGRKEGPLPSSILSSTFCPGWHILTDALPFFSEITAMPFPRMLRLRQSFDCPRVDDIADEVERQLQTLKLGERVKPGQSVAITVGSRGIANVALITRAIVAHFKR